MRTLILGRESIWGLATSVMNYSTSMPPWVPVVGTAETVKGLWLTKPLIPQQPHTLWSTSLRRREDQSSLDTFSQWALPLFCLYLSLFIWTLNSITLCVQLWWYRASKTLDILEALINNIFDLSEINFRVHIKTFLWPSSTIHWHQNHYFFGLPLWFL